MKDRLVNFTNTKLSKLENNTGKIIEYRDSTQKGLVLRISKTGTVKAFRFEYWDTNTKRKYKSVLGRYPTMLIPDAREIVKRKISQLSMGINVEEEKRKMSEELTLNDAFHVWLETHAKPNLKRWQEEQRRYELYIQPYFGTKLLGEITPDHITLWKIKLSKQKKKNNKKGTLSPGVIHRIFIVLSSIFGKAAKNIPNPCALVVKYQAEPRTVFLGPDHLKLFFAEVHGPETPQWLRDYLLLSIYTGARKANILSMAWVQFDLDLKIWIIPTGTTKNKSAQTVPLLDSAVEILRAIKENGESDKFVFPSPHANGSKTGHLSDPKRAWKAFLKRAELPLDYRMHDLRRTMGSWQAMTGASTKLIGASLGHKSEKATASYAHLLLDPVRGAMEKAASAIEKAAMVEEKQLAEK